MDFEKNNLGPEKENAFLKNQNFKSRQEKPAVYPDRFPVPDDKINWESEYKEYKPPYFVAPVVLENDYTKKADGWADPEEFVGEKLKNPMGRTGIEGRGLLGKWGPNFAADSVVTGLNQESGEIEVLVIQRKDNEKWALPGGMVDKGEKVSATSKREFKEEVGIDLDMDDATEVYTGYVDDSRNTDDAWIETVAMHKHLADNTAKPKAGDDAEDARWLPVTKDNLNILHANHAELVKNALADFYSKNIDKISDKLKKQIESLL